MLSCVGRVVAPGSSGRNTSVSHGSIAFDEGGERPDRPEDFAVFIFTLRDRDAVLLLQEQCDFQCVDRIQTEALAEDMAVRIDVGRTYFQVQSLHDERS